MKMYIVIANGEVIGAYTTAEKATEKKNRYNNNREMGGYHDGYAYIREVEVTE